jgi:hypothetical protein
MPNYEGEKISKVMVMGIGADSAVVDEYETAFTEMLSKKRLVFWSQRA